MAQKVDLHECFFLGERRELDFLHAYDLVVGQLAHKPVEIELSFGDGNGRGVNGFLAVAGLAIDDARLVLAQLAQHLRCGDVDGCVHIVFVLFHADDVALRAQCDFAGVGAGVRWVLFFAQDDFGVEGVDIHDLHRVADFLLGIGAQRVGYRHFAAGYGNAHSYHLTIVANKKQPGRMPLSMRVYLRFRYPSAWNMLAPYLEADRYSIAQNGVGGDEYLRPFWQRFSYNRR